MEVRVLGRHRLGLVVAEVLGALDSLEGYLTQNRSPAWLIQE
jgi:hypothetical protein